MHIDESMEPPEEKNEEHLHPEDLQPPDDHDDSRASPVRVENGSSSKTPKPILNRVVRS